MLNNLSVLDIAAHLIRKTKRFLSVAIISGLLFAVIRYGTVYMRSSSLSQQIREKKELAEEKRAVYEQYLSRRDGAPISGIDPEETYVTSVIYYCDGIDASEETDYDQSLTGFCEMIIARWNAEDISGAVEDCYAASVDDSDVRMIADLFLDQSSCITLAVRSKDEKEGADTAERLCVLIDEMISEVKAETGAAFRFRHSERIPKCVYDEGIEAKQKELQKKASEYEKEYREALSAYEDLAVKADPVREACKWGIIGALISVILLFSYYVCEACLSEPVLSAGQIERRTGLRFIGSLRRPCLLNALSSVLNRDPLCSDRKMGKENLMWQTDEICGDANELLAVCLGVPSDDEEKTKYSMCLKEKGIELIERSGSEGLDALTESMKKQIRSILIIKEDETDISDLEKVIELSEKYDCHIEGFIVS